MPGGPMPVENPEREKERRERRGGREGGRQRNTFDYLKRLAAAPVIRLTCV